jgi:succinyl-diaminopimelate desuccinylase
MHVEHILEKLIRFQTVTGNDSEVERLFNWIKDELQPVPVYVREYHPHGHPALIITPSNKKRVRLWLAAHVDVVPGADGLFHPEKKGNRIIGRGAYDMKFAVACYVALAKELGTDYRDYDLGIMLTSDEELGQEDGVAHVLAHEGYTGDVAFLPDGTGSWHFEEAAKGSYLLEVQVRGKPAHGSRPWLGVSANHTLASFVHDLSHAFTAFVKDDPEHWYTTMHVGKMSGGEAYNMVAPHATASIDMRYTDHHAFTKIQQILRTLKRQYEGVTTRVIAHYKPYGISRNNPHAEVFARVAKEHGVTTGWARAHGLSDARFFHREGIPVVLISPTGGDSHGDREWVDVRALRTYYAILRSFVEEVAKK